MNFQKGQVVWGKIRFADGEMPKYNRPYLIMEVYADYIEVLTVSSVQGKEHKLLFPSNEKLKAYDPPLKKPSFVKLDSLVQVPLNSCQDLRVLHGGECLDDAEFSRICMCLEEFKKEHH